MLRLFANGERRGLGMTTEKELTTTVTTATATASLQIRTNLVDGIIEVLGLSMPVIKLLLFF